MESWKEQRQRLVTRGFTQRPVQEYVRETSQEISLHYRKGSSKQSNVLSESTIFGSFQFLCRPMLSS